MKETRRLTGQYYITRCLFGWKIMVECIVIGNSFRTDIGADRHVWKKARMDDFIQLGIVTN